MAPTKAAPKHSTEAGLTLSTTYQHARVHDRWHEVYLKGRYQDRLNDRLVDRLLSLAEVAKGGLWLDGGCGRGDHGGRIVARGYQCIGVDLSRMVLPRAKGRGLRLCCSALETLPFPDDTFDGVHCRGVLMHIPQWRLAVAELCRVLKPGGSLIIGETNARSLETKLVLLARRFGAGRSRLASTVDGLEFWSEVERDPFLVRMANITALIQTLRARQVTLRAVLATEFWDINRFPAILRPLILRWNRVWLGSKLWRYSAGVAVVGRKSDAASESRDFSTPHRPFRTS